MVNDFPDARLSKRLGIEVYCYEEVSSTMDLAAYHSPTAVVIAETQTSGRGRGEKSWFSPPGAGLYCSFVFSAKKPEGAYMGYSLAVGVGLKRALRAPTVQLKWPNDLLYQGRKLGGVLIEFRNHLIIGIGLNLRTCSYPQGVSAAALDEFNAFEREDLLVGLCSELKDMHQQFERSGFEHFRQEWLDSAAFQGKEVSLALGQETIRGIFEDVNTDGAAVINGKAYYSGELRPCSVKDVSMRSNCVTSD